MLSEYPIPDGSWLRPVDGAFRLDETYYAASGRIFEPPQSYTSLLRD